MSVEPFSIISLLAATIANVHESAKGGMAIATTPICVLLYPLTTLSELSTQALDTLVSVHGAQQNVIASESKLLNRYRLRSYRCDCPKLCRLPLPCRCRTFSAAGGGSPVTVYGAQIRCLNCCKMKTAAGK